jgi:hypothetical protein
MIGEEWEESFRFDRANQWQPYRATNYQGALTKVEAFKNFSGTETHPTSAWLKTSQEGHEAEPFQKRSRTNRTDAIR